MILVCSAGHELNTKTKTFQLRNRWRDKKKGDKCRVLIRYDRMHGSSYCERRLKVKDDETYTKI